MWLKMSAARRRRWWTRHCNRAKRRHGNGTWILQLIGKTLFIDVMSWNEKNNMRLEQNHFLFHESTLMLSDILRQLRTYNKNTKSTTIGMSTLNDHYQDLGLNSQDFQFWRTSLPEGHVWAGDRLTKIQTTSRMDMKLLARNMVEQKKTSWTLHSDWEECITVLRMIRNLTTSSKNGKRKLETHTESATPCEAQKKDAERQTLPYSLSTSREGPCAETQGEISCTKEKKNWS